MIQLKQNLMQILDDKNTNLKPENLKKGVTCLGINGTLEPAKVLMFKSKEEMLNTRNVDINTIGVVTNTKPIQIELNTKIKNIYLPKQIVMETPITITDEKGFRLVSADSNYNGLCVYYSKTRLNIAYSSNNHDDMMNADYKSEDGITYTQQYVNGGTMYNCYWPKESVLVTRYLDMNAENEYEPTEFEKSLAKTLNIYYDDSYQYISTKDREYMTGIKSIKLSDDGTSGIVDETISVFEPLLDAFIPDIVKQMKCYYGMGVTIFRNDNNEYLLGPGSGNIYNVIYKNGKWYIRAERDNHNPYYYATLNFDTFKCNTPIVCSKDWTFTKIYSSSQTVYYFMELNGYYPVAQINIMSDGSYELNYEYLDGTYFPTDDTSVEKQYNIESDQFGHIEFLGWHRLLKNSNLQYPYELLDGISAYGQHGLITGNGTILDHLDMIGYTDKYRNTNTVLYGENDAGGKSVQLQDCTSLEQFKNAKILEYTNVDVGNILPLGQYLGVVKNTGNSDEDGNNGQIITIYDTNMKYITKHDVNGLNGIIGKYVNNKIYLCTTKHTSKGSNTSKLVLYTYDITSNTWTDTILASGLTGFSAALYVTDNGDTYSTAIRYSNKGPYTIYKNGTALFTKTFNIYVTDLNILYVDDTYVYIAYTSSNDKGNISKFTMSGTETVLASFDGASVGIDSRYIVYYKIDSNTSTKKYIIGYMDNGAIVEWANKCPNITNSLYPYHFTTIIHGDNKYIFTINGILYNCITGESYTFNNISTYQNMYCIDKIIAVHTNNSICIIRPDIMFTDEHTDNYIVPTMGKTNYCQQAYLVLNDVSTMFKQTN